MVLPRLVSTASNKPSGMVPAVELVAYLLNVLLNMLPNSLPDRVSIATNKFVGMIPVVEREA